MSEEKSKSRPDSAKRRRIDNLGGKGKATQFSKENQPDRYRGKSLMTLIKKQLFSDEEYLTLRNCEVVEEVSTGGAKPKLVPTGVKVIVRVKMTNADALAIHYVNRAKKSDKVLINAVDRIDGKATHDY